ncbi:MAG: D-sedoheptulose 7-phosphate isomerase [Deltaproteobacteria bacterium]|nr:D-sedoheptulose 7-phosphate isomerase [Deltaproteobacteria bacterium]MBW2307981.1 D-sedoheptulose 7-phosphate isomerase [Deltaproteobacteria bacterium]
MEEHIRSWFEEHSRIVAQFMASQAAQMRMAGQTIAEALQKGGKLMLFGNGGSAADAQHLAAEFVNRFQFERPPLPALALTTDSSVITSITNDQDFSEIFVRQIKSLGRAGDVAMGISTSGRSLNVIKGVQAARKMGLFTIGLVGSNGTGMIEAVDLAISVPSSSTPHVQEVHIIAGHVICHLVDMILFHIVE